jgi:ElaB/YqjD/DUF883 family membrane-anchored ribosome-binding protein
MSKNIMESLAVELEAPSEKLVAELKQMVADAEDLLSATASQTGEVAAIARDRIQNSLKVVNRRLHAAEASIISHTRNSAKAADQYAHTNPWQLIGVAAVAAVIISMMIRRS